MSVFDVHMANSGAPHLFAELATYQGVKSIEVDRGRRGGPPTVLAKNIDAIIGPDMLVQVQEHESGAMIDRIEKEIVIMVDNTTVHGGLDKQRLTQAKVRLTKTGTANGEEWIVSETSAKTDNMMTLRLIRSTIKEGSLPGRYS